MGDKKLPVCYGHNYMQWEFLIRYKWIKLFNILIWKNFLLHNITQWYNKPSSQYLKGEDIVLTDL